MPQSPSLIDFERTRVFHPPWEGPTTALESRVTSLEDELVALTLVVAAITTDPAVLDRILVDASGDVISDANGDVLWD